MNRNTIVEIAIPKALYESIKGKILSEAKADKEDKKDLKEDGFLNELFGFSKKEKETKALKSEIEKAKSEVDKFKFKRLISQHCNPELQTQKDLRDAVARRLGSAKMEMPTVAKLLPDLFTLNDKMSNAVFVIVPEYSDCKHTVPDKWGFAVRSHEVDQEKGVEELKSKLDALLSMNEAKKKPSAGLTKAEKSTIAKKAAAGKDIGKKGKGFEKVAAKAAKEYGSKEAGKKVAAAQMWKSQASKKK